MLSSIELPDASDIEDCNARQTAFVNSLYQTITDVSAIAEDNGHKCTDSVFMDPLFNNRRQLF